MTWKTMPMWKKRLHGFFSYQLAAFVSLIYPVEADLAMFDVLKEQFKGLQQNSESQR